MKIRFLLALLVLTITAVHASAQTCSASYSNMNFGVVDLTTGGAYPTSATNTVSCSGTAGQVIYVCGSGSIAGPYAMGPVQFSLYRDSAGTTAWNGAGTVTIGSNGSGSLSQTVYGRLASGQQQVAPNAYQSSGFAIASYGLTPLCGTAMSAAVPAVLSYPASCHISAQAMTFSPNGLLSSATDATTSVSATCSYSSPYDVLLDGGQTQATDPTQRKLSFGGNQITYGLYQNSSRTIPWGSTIGANTEAGTGSGQMQTLLVYGRIPAQPTPPPATYQDLITVTISY